MAIKLIDKYLGDFVSEEEIAALQPMVNAAHEMLVKGCGLGSDFLGWYQLPENYDKEEFARIKKAASKIQSDSDILIVIGIGGSYLGARAVIEAVKTSMYNAVKKDTPDIYFAGNNISATQMHNLLSVCEGKDVSINVISKSGTTTEPAIAFRILKQFLEEKYGDKAASRIYVTTDKQKGTLRNLATEMGYETFVVPDDVGGRYSVLTAVGLLPIAAAGIDIDKLMAGARNAMKALSHPDLNQNDAYKYAAIRNIFYRKGKTTEIQISYEPSLQQLGEWWKQLYGESEGKDGRGVFPVTLNFSTDLHSVGQYVQQGLHNFFESVIWVDEMNYDVKVPNDPKNVDGLNFLTGESMSYVNKRAFQGTILAHTDGGSANIILQMPSVKEEEIGYLIYFFEIACAITSYLQGVNPFNQPGVEAYKKNMFILLGKPGYEDQKDALESRL